MIVNMFNTGGNDDAERGFNEAFEICAAHPGCVDCPIAAGNYVLKNGNRCICNNYAMFGQRSKQGEQNES